MFEGAVVDEGTLPAKLEELVKGRVGKVPVKADVTGVPRVEAEKVGAADEGPLKTGVEAGKFVGLAFDRGAPKRVLNPETDIEKLVCGNELKVEVLFWAEDWPPEGELIAEVGTPVVMKISVLLASLGDDLLANVLRLKEVVAKKFAYCV